MHDQLGMMLDQPKMQIASFGTYKTNQNKLIFAHPPENDLFFTLCEV